MISQNPGDGVDTQDRTDFISGYTKLVLATWSDEAIGDRLVSDPKSVLAQFGLTVPASATVTVVRHIPPDHGDPDVDFQVNLWEKGLESGNFEMHVPETPQIDMEELSDSELEGITGGRANTVGAAGVSGAVTTTASGDWCTSCTPCCCCA
jgi:hypothetical protein